MEDLLGAEVEGAVGPAQHIEDGLAGEQILDLLELRLVDPTAGDREPREALARGLALGVERVDLVAGQEPAAHEHLAERPVGPRIGGCRRHDGTAIESQLHLPTIGCP